MILLSRLCWRLVIECLRTTTRGVCEPHLDFTLQAMPEFSQLLHFRSQGHLEQVTREDCNWNQSIMAQAELTFSQLLAAQVVLQTQIGSEE